MMNKQRALASLVLSLIVAVTYIVATISPAHATAITGKVKNLYGASVKIWQLGEGSRIIYQSEKLYGGVTQVKPRYDKRCAYVATGRRATSGFYKWDAGQTHATHGYTITFHAWRACNDNYNKGWVAKIL